MEQLFRLTRYYFARGILHDIIAVLNLHWLAICMTFHFLMHPYSNQTVYVARSISAPSYLSIL